MGLVGASAPRIFNMTDARLRDLERRWKETSAPQDEAVYLLERVRIGDLTQERLELAAYCWHKGARATISAAPPPSDFLKWIEGFTRWGNRGVAAAALALAQAVLPFITVETGDRSLEPVLVAGEAYLRNPSPGTAGDFERVGAESNLGLAAPAEWSRGSRHAYECVQNAVTCIWVDGSGRPGDEAAYDLMECAKAALKVELEPALIVFVRARLITAALHGW